MKSERVTVGGKERARGLLLPHPGTSAKPDITQGIPEQFDNPCAPCIVDEHMQWLVEAKPPVGEGVNG